MSEDKKHTPLPYACGIKKDFGCYESGNYTEELMVYRPNGQFSEVICKGFYGNPDDAEFIVTACNSHYELLEIAKHVHKYFDADEEFYQNLEAAIAKAEGK